MRIPFPSPARLTRACLLAGLAALLSGCLGERGNLPTGGGERQITVLAQRYLDSALSIMEIHSVRKHQVDWPGLRARAFAHAGAAQDEDDAHDAIRVALREIGDGHSSLALPRWTPTGVYVERPPPAGTVLEGGRVGYVRVPFFVDTGGVQHAADYHALLRRLDGPAVCGWIVDLRGTRGGNMWPMLVGIGPILGGGHAGAFVDANGYSTHWGYADGSAYTTSSSGHFPVPDPYRLRRPDPPVAVLTAQPTVSAGEAIAVSFRGRPNTRTFGTPTRGLSSANSIFVLPDNALLILTTAYLADRTGVVYQGKLPPDVTVDAPEGPDPARDAVAAAARAWLESHPACAL